MRWTCPKCGKKLEISNEQLIANDGVIVCPQCLLQARQPVPKSRVTTRKATQAPTTNHTRQSISFDAEATTPPEYHQPVPPPHKPRMKQASTSYRYTGLSGNSNSNSSTQTRRKPATTKKKKSKKKHSQGMSAWGCLGRTIVFTLVLFAAYVFFGLLLEALQ